MLHHLKVWKHYPPPRKKKVKPKRSVTPPTPWLTVFAVGWVFCIISCRFEMFCHQAVRTVTDRSQVLRRHQACASQVNVKLNTSSIHFGFDLCPIGVGGNASCCMGNHPDHIDELKLITDGKSVSDIGSGVIIKRLGTFEFNIKDDTDQAHIIRIPNSQYVPSLERVLFSPHHWAQEASDNHPQRHWTITAQCNDGIILPRTQPLGARSYRTHVAVIEALRACTPHFRWKQATLHLGHSPVTPEDDKYYCKHASEGVSTADNTVKHEHLASKGVPSDSDFTQIARWTVLGTKSCNTFIGVIEILKSCCTPHICQDHVIQCPDHYPVTPELDDELIVVGNLLPRSHSSSPDRVSANATMSNLKKPPPVVCNVSSSTPAVATTPILLPSSYPALTSTSVKLSTLTQGCPEHPSFQTVNTVKSSPAAHTPSSVTLPFVLAGLSYIHKMDLYAEILWHQSSAPFSSCHQESLHCHRACAAQAVVHTKKSSLLAQHRQDCYRNTPKSQVYSHSVAETSAATRQKVEHLHTRTA